MPSILSIMVVEARDLPIMDKRASSTDAYVQILSKGAQKIHRRTRTQRSTLNPVWSEEFKFEIVDDEDLQDNPVRFVVMDQDFLDADDQIGVVYTDLGCLLMRADDTSSTDSGDGVGYVAGWFPIIDSLRGNCGELHLVMSLRFIPDANQWDESSAGVKFFGVSHLAPSVYKMREVRGLVEELVVEEDPEYSWQDTIRSSRATNEMRLELAFRLSGRVRRQVGQRVKELGCNAVLAYHEHFDVEGDSGIVARGYGTACRIEPVAAHAREEEGGGGRVALQGKGEAHADDFAKGALRAHRSDSMEELLLLQQQSSAHFSDKLLRAATDGGAPQTPGAAAPPPRTVLGTAMRATSASVATPSPFLRPPLRRSASAAERSPSLSGSGAVGADAFCGSATAPEAVRRSRSHTARLGLGGGGSRGDEPHASVRRLFLCLLILLLVAHSILLFAHFYSFVCSSIRLFVRPLAARVARVSRRVRPRARGRRAAPEQLRCGPSGGSVRRRDRVRTRASGADSHPHCRGRHR